jgi:transcriptional antiterminator NusG
MTNRSSQPINDTLATPTTQVDAVDDTADAAVESSSSSMLTTRGRRPSHLLTTKQAGKRGWYVVHTYTGYEDQVAENLRQRIESLGMAEKIFDVIVPTEKQIEIKNGKRRIVERKIFPGYVLVEMLVTDDSWYVVRNTPNVTGFIGLGVRPTAMAEEEVERIKKRMGIEEPKYKIELKLNDLVRIIDGPLKNFEAKVTDIDEEKGKIKVLINMFGRETPVKLDFLQVRKA